MNEKRRRTDSGVASWFHNPIATVTLMLTLFSSIVLGTTYINKVDSKASQNKSDLAKTESAIKDVKQDVKDMRDEVKSELSIIRGDIKDILKALK
jgi:outer membrane protein TolC